MSHHNKDVTIIVEGTPHEWPKDSEISYAQVVTLEVPIYPQQNPKLLYSVKYNHGPAHKPHGILAPNESVKVKEGMTFNVSETGES